MWSHSFDRVADHRYLDRGSLSRLEASEHSTSHIARNARRDSGDADRSHLVVEQHTNGREDDYLTWTATGFAAMGVLDVLHAAAGPSNTTIWLHSIAILIGGLAFSLVWADSSWIPKHARILIPCLALVLAMCLGIGAHLLPATVPQVSQNLQFGPSAIWLNRVGGAGFLAAAGFFVIRFHRHYDITDWLLAVQAALFGAVSLLVSYSSYWDLTWWWWHVLRVIAYVAAFVVAVRSYLGVEKKALACQSQTP